MDFTLTSWCDWTVPLRRCDTPVQDILKHLGCGMAVTCHFGQVLDVLQIGHEKLHIRNMIWTTVLGVHCESIQIRSTDRDTDTDNTYVKSWFYGHNFGPWKPHSEFAVFYHLIPSILFLHFVDPNSPACLIASPRMWPLQCPSQKPPIGMHFACLYNTFLISFGMVYHWPKATLLAQEFADLPKKSLWPKAMGDIPVCWWDMRQIGGSWWISRYVSRVLGLLLEKELNDYRKTFFPYLSMLGSLFSLMSLHRADPHPWRQLGEVVSRCIQSHHIAARTKQGVITTRGPSHHKWHSLIPSRYPWIYIYIIIRCT